MSALHARPQQCGVLFNPNPTIQQRAQAVEPVGHVRMLCTQCLLPDGHRTLEVGLGLVVLALGCHGDAQNMSALHARPHQCVVLLNPKPYHATTSPGCGAPWPRQGALHPVPSHRWPTHARSWPWPRRTCLGLPWERTKHVSATRNTSTMRCFVEPKTLPCSSSPRLLSPVATSGCSAPSAFSKMANARSRCGLASSYLPWAATETHEACWQCTQDFNNAAHS